MNINFFAPRTELQPYIERYWNWESTPGQNDVYMPVIPPATGIELFIHHKDPFSINHRGELTSNHLVFSTEKPSTILPSHHVGFLAIRFRTGMFRYFTDVPLVELNSHFVDMQGIWGLRGKEVFERVSNTIMLADKISVMEEFLINRLSINRETDPVWDLIITRLHKLGGNAVLEYFARELNITHRHFRRKFIAQTGIAPKHFQQLSRFHATIKPLLLSGSNKYLSSALDNGYFDQNHFIKEFKQYMEITPSDFLQKKNFMSHFYYPTL